MKLTPVMEKYILHWGEMGTRWGVNRSVSQIHALLYLAPEPLNAEQITAILSIARSNVSTSIKELLSWQLIKTTPVLGDRRDHFDAVGDTWDMLMTIVAQRKQREIDPTLALLRQCVQEMENDQQTPNEVKLRISTMTDFVSSMAHWYEQMQQLPKSTLIKLFSLGTTITRFLPKK